MKMRKGQLSGSEIDVALGYAAGDDGSGIAYARLVTGSGEHLLRVPFQVQRASRRNEREVGYAALTAVATRLRRGGVRRARFALDDEKLVDDLMGHRDVPDPIVLPYVRLRCALNQFGAFTLKFAVESDLAQRARAEVAMHTAA